MDAVNFTITDFVSNLDFVNLRKLGGREGACEGGGGGDMLIELCKGCTTLFGKM